MNNMTEQMNNMNPELMRLWRATILGATSSADANNSSNQHSNNNNSNSNNTLFTSSFHHHHQSNNGNSNNNSNNNSSNNAFQQHQPTKTLADTMNGGSNNNVSSMNANNRFQPIPTINLQQQQQQQPQHTPLPEKISSFHNQHQHTTFTAPLKQRLTDSTGTGTGTSTSTSIRTATNREHPIDLTLEEIFRDHDLQESSDNLESSMDNLGEESNSDLSGIFDDEDQAYQHSQNTTTRQPAVRRIAHRRRSNSAPPTPSFHHDMANNNMNNHHTFTPVAAEYHAGDTAISNNNNHNKNNNSSHHHSSNNNNNNNSTTATTNQQRFKPFHEEKWNARLAELMRYRTEHGDCLVPHTYSPNPQLARWVKRQRRQYKLMLEKRASTMTPERLQILHHIDFVWDSHEAAWQEKLNELNEYRMAKGNCLVPSNYKTNPQLATWVKCQRRQHKLYWEGRPSAMTPERIIQLEKIGFEWEIRSSGQSNCLARSDYVYLSEAISKMG